MPFRRLRDDIDAIRQRDPAARGAFEVLTCYPGLHALLWHRLAHRCWRAKLRWLARSFAYVSRSITGIEIHPAASIGARVFIDHGMGVVIGETAVVGDDCTIYHGVTLGGTSLRRGTRRHPTLEAGVVVGAGAKILGAFTVGAGARIGANAVVTGAVTAGARVPAGGEYGGTAASVREAALRRSHDADAMLCVSDGRTACHCGVAVHAHATRATRAIPDQPEP